MDDPENSTAKQAKEALKYLLKEERRYNLVS